MAMSEPEIMAGSNNLPDSKATSLPSNENERAVSDPDVKAFDGYTTLDEDDGSSGTSSDRSSHGNVVYRLCSWYDTQMTTRPVRTKCFTAGILAIVGDSLAQIIEHYSGLREYTTTTGEVDQRRMLAMFIEGFFVSGPVLHFVYEYYEYVLPIHCLEDCNCIDIAFDLPANEVQNDEAEYMDEPNEPYSMTEWTAGRRKLFNAMLQVAFDNIIMTFFYVFSMMTVTALVEGHGDQLLYELENDFWPAMQASWLAALILSPFEILAFRYLPPRYRVLAVSLQDVIWVCVMSYMAHRNREPSYVNDEDIW